MFPTGLWDSDTRETVKGTLLQKWGALAPVLVCPDVNYWAQFVAHFWKCRISALYHFGGHLDGSFGGGAQASQSGGKMGHL